MGGNDGLLSRRISPGICTITSYFPRTWASNTWYHNCSWSSQANTNKAGETQYLDGYPFNIKFKTKRRTLCCHIPLKYSQRLETRLRHQNTPSNPLKTCVGLEGAVHREHL